MFCAACAEETAETPCIHCGSDPLLEERYRLEHRLGHGASGITWAATRLEDGALVAIKAVPLPPGLDAKDRELVAREVEVLRQIHHPGIPDLLDAFQVRGGAGMRVQYLVQEFVAGRTLAEELRERRFDEDAVLAILQEAVPILAYLHALSPPIVHRDLKPSNLMRRSDGGLVLIDFGAVKDALSDPQLGGSTVAGTFGFMAPEQFRGDAEPRTDLYALGVTAVALLSREVPHTMLGHDGRLQWRDRVSVSPGVEGLLSDLLQPDPGARPATADAVLARVTALREAPAADAAEVPEPFFASAPDPAEEVPPPVRVSAAESPEDQQTRATLVGMAAVMVLGVGIFVFLASGDADRKVDHFVEPAAQKAIEAAPPPTACDGPCAPVGDFRLRDLQLGQTVEEATAAFPELADGEERSEGVPHHIDDLMREVGEVRDPDLPGPVWRVRTLLAGEVASCNLHFEIDEQLSRVRCLLDDIETDDQARSQVRRIADAVAEEHGPGRRQHDGDQVFGEWAMSWTWSDRTGSLVVEGERTILGAPVVRLDVRTREHARAVSREQQRLQEQSTRDAARRQQELEAAKQQELQELMDKIGQPTDGGL